MSNTNILIECAREVYEGEKGLGFTEDSTYITWHTPDTTPLELDLRLDPLVLARPDDDEFRVIKARLWVGLDEARIRISDRAEDTAHGRFAERFVSAYEVHDHALCIEAAKKAAALRQIALVGMRKPLSGEITKYT